MESASHELEFELAARYRDQIANLRRVQARQYVLGSEGGNVDVIATRAREGVAVVELFVIRNGQNLGSRTLRTGTRCRTSTRMNCCARFLPQHYLSRSGRERPIPDEILLSPRRAGGSMCWEQAIAEQSGRKVRIRSNVRGERARWVEMAVNNAEIALQQRIASRANLHDQFEALQELLGPGQSTGAHRMLRCEPIPAARSMVASCVRIRA